VHTGRLFEILYYLQAHGSATARQLAQRFEVSERTIRRDIDALSAAGVPVYTRPGRTGGVALLEGYRLDTALLSEAEQTEVLAGLRGMAGLGGESAATALGKLSGALAHPGDWLEVDFLPWGLEAAQKPLFQTLKAAILGRRRLAFTYFGASGEKTQRVAEPAKLCYKSSAWYLQAFCLARGEWRTFKLCRMLGARMLEQGFEPGAHGAPPPLDSEEEPPCMLQMELMFLPCAAHRVYDLFCPQDVTPLPDGRFFVSARWPRGGFLVSMLLSFGPSVAVLGPPELQKAVADEALHILQLYRQGTPAEKP